MPEAVLRWLRDVSHGFPTGSLGRYDWLALALAEQLFVPSQAAGTTPSGPQLVPTSETSSLGVLPTDRADSLGGIAQPRRYLLFSHVTEEHPSYAWQ